MNRNKQIALNLISYISSLLQGQINIFFTGIDHLHTLHIIFNQTSQLQGNSQIDVFLFRLAAERAGIVPAMTGIDHHDKIFGQQDGKAQSKSHKNRQ